MGVLLPQKCSEGRRKKYSFRELTWTSLDSPPPHFHNLIDCASEPVIFRSHFSVSKTPTSRIQALQGIGIIEPCRSEAMMSICRMPVLAAPESL